VRGRVGEGETEWAECRIQNLNFKIQNSGSRINESEGEADDC